MQLDQFPSTFIYAEDGTLVSKHVGAADWSDPTVISYRSTEKTITAISTSTFLHNSSIPFCISCAISVEMNIRKNFALPGTFSGFD